MEKMASATKYCQLLTFVVAAGLLALASVRIIAAPGDLDPTFGIGGTSTSSISNVTVTKVILQPDGKIIVIGKRAISIGLGEPAKDYLMVRRYTANGALDTIFNTTLKRGIGYDAEVQADGKIVVIGTAPNSVTNPLTGTSVNTTSPVVWRFNANGTIDTGFGTNGATFINTTAAGNLHIDVFDSRVVIGYASRSPFFSPLTINYRITRLSPVGAVDFTRTLPFAYNSDEKAFSMKIDPATGDIVAAGIKSSNQNAVLVRYTIDNAVVTGFGLNGEAAVTDCSAQGIYELELLPKDIEILPDGTMLVLRWRFASGSSQRVWVSKMNADGGAGSVCTALNIQPAWGEDLFVQPDGKFFYYLGVNGSNYRYFPDGSFDASFQPAIFRPSVIQPDQKAVSAWAEYPNYDSIRLERRLLD